MSNFSEQDYHFMARAIQLADRPILSPHPNPRVGCVIMRDGETVGEGWHAMAGRDHAEAMALKQAGDRAQGATAYVTLEPCSHHGRTPPCADALIEAGVKRVVMAMDDPSEKVNGQGKVRLQQAGIAVESGLLQQQAESLNKGFIKRHRLGMPWIRIKSAMTLDGRTAMSNGESKWITAEAARRDVQRLRAQCDAILTGIGTVQLDDPSLTLREEELGHAVNRQPLRVIVDSHRRMANNARVCKAEGDYLHVVAKGEAEDHQVLLPNEQGRIDLSALMKELASREINEVQVESGATLIGALITEGLVDELVLYMAPAMIGDGARGLAYLPKVARMNQRVNFEIADIRAIGKDWRITALPVQSGE